jgi:hypothetical protein
MALLLRVTVRNVCSTRKTNFIFKAHLVFFFLFVFKKNHKTSKTKNTKGFFCWKIKTNYCCSMSIMLTRSTRKQLDEMLQKSGQVGPFGG